MSSVGQISLLESSDFCGIKRRVIYNNLEECIQYELWRAFLMNFQGIALGVALLTTHLTLVDIYVFSLLHTDGMFHPVTCVFRYYFNAFRRWRNVSLEVSVYPSICLSVCPLTQFLKGSAVKIFWKSVGVWDLWEFCQRSIYMQNA